MPKDWKEISDDEILNFDGPQTAQIARYERIMQKKSIDALHNVKEKISGLMETIHRTNQGLKEKTDELIGLYEKIAKAQNRQQNVLIALSIVVAVSTAVYTIIAWQSITAMKEANQIQKEFLELERRLSP